MKARGVLTLPPPRGRVKFRSGRLGVTESRLRLPETAPVITIVVDHRARNGPQEEVYDNEFAENHVSHGALDGTSRRHRGSDRRQERRPDRARRSGHHELHRLLVERQDRARPLQGAGSHARAGAEALRYGRAADPARGDPDAPSLRHPVAPRRTRSRRGAIRSTPRSR